MCGDEKVVVILLKYGNICNKILSRQHTECHHHGTYLTHTHCMIAVLLYMYTF